MPSDMAGTARGPICACLGFGRMPDLTSMFLTRADLLLDIRRLETNRLPRTIAARPSAAPPAIPRQSIFSSTRRSHLRVWWPAPVGRHPPCQASRAPHCCSCCSQEEAPLWRDLSVGPHPVLPIPNREAEAQYAAESHPTPDPDSPVLSLHQSLCDVETEAEAVAPAPR